LFHLDKQAGAPPDIFAVNGQNWGFPIAISPFSAIPN
ncbi:4-alpha-glucanotransferase, partial [Lactococcus lactis]